MAKENVTIADKWIKRIDDNSPAVMMSEADVITETDVYIFSDGSAVYEKRRGDWYPAGQYLKCQQCDDYYDEDEAINEDEQLCNECTENNAEEKQDEAATALLKSKVL